MSDEELTAIKKQVAKTHREVGVIWMILIVLLLGASVQTCAKAQGQGVIAPATNAPVWQQARMHEVALQWEPSPDAVFYRIYVLSIKTTNQWTSKPEWLLPAADDKHAPVNHSIFVDLSVPTWTRITAIDAAHRESAPTQPVFHPADVPPRPPGQHRFMYSRPMVEAVAHRARITPMPVPPLPPDAGQGVIVFRPEYSWFISPSIGFFNDDTGHSSWHTATNAQETTVKMILRDGSVWQALLWKRVP